MQQSDWRHTLRGAREQLGLSQGELARRASLSEETVRAYEAGRRRPALGSLNKLFEALRVNAEQRNRVLLSLGFAPVETRFPEDRFPGYFYTVNELQTAVEDVTWPEFVLNDNVEVVAANEAVQAVWGIDFQAERARRSRPQTNLLSLASHHMFTDHVVNWEECLSAIVSVLKGRPERSDSLDAPDAYFNAVLQEFAGGDPSFLAGLIDVWQKTEGRAPKVRWSYRVVWRDPDFGELRFLGIVSNASETDALSFNDWHPLDAASWEALDLVKGRRGRRGQGRADTLR